MTKQLFYKLTIAILGVISGFISSNLVGCGSLHLQELDYTPTEEVRHVSDAQF